MGYELKGSKSFSHEIKRIVTEQIDKALDCLKRTGRNKDEGIHGARDESNGRATLTADTTFITGGQTFWVGLNCSTINAM